MYDVIRSLAYKTRTNIIFKAALLGVTGLMFVMITSIDDGAKLCGSQLAVCFSDSGFFLLMQCIAIGGIIIGSDFNDKTLNYEVMSGHNKKEIYFSRMIVAFSTAFIATIIAINVPVIVVSAIGGWGDVISLRSYIFRIVMIILPVFKFIALMQLLCFVMRNYFAAIAIGFVVVFFEVMITGFIDLPRWINNLLIVTSFSKLLGYVSNVNELTGSVSYISRISNSDLAVVISINLIMGLLFMIGGYIYCKKNDLDT